MAKSTHQVRVRIGQVPYTRPGSDPPELIWAYGAGMPQIDPAQLFGADFDPDNDEHAAAAEDFRLGQLIELNKADYDRLSATGAVGDVTDVEEEVQARDAVAGGLHVAEATVDDLAQWIRTEKPSVNDVVRASGGEADNARRLLEAEALAQDGEPRNGVVKGLSTVIGRDG